MAFLHLLNCLLLTFAPIFVVFNSTSLHEHGIRACTGGFLSYMGAALAKLVLYASLVPVSEEWSIFTEIPKELISVIDIYAISTAFTWKTVRIPDKKTRMIGVGLGWAAGELIFSNLLILCFNAGGGEFSWEYLQRAITANCSLFQLITLACLVFIENYSSGVWSVTATALVVAQVFIRPLIIGYAVSTGLVTSWVVLALQVVWSLGLVLLGKILVEFSN